MSDKSTWGGKRPGAGRPKGRKKVSRTIMIPIELEAKLERIATKRGVSFSQVVSDNLIKALG